MEENYNILGRNIKKMRESWGETLLDLSLFLETSTSAISQWESGKRIPSHQILEKIAIRYQTTVDCLLSKDLSYFPSMVDYFVKLKEDYDSLQEEGKLLFPIFKLEQSEENSMFTEALSIHKKLFGKNSGAVSSFEIEIMFNNYQQLFEVDRILAAGANILSLIFLCVDTSQIAPVFEEFSEYIKQKAGRNKEKSAKFFLVNYYLDSQLENNQEEVDLEPQEIDEEVLGVIKELRSDIQWSPVGDYYFALRYLYGFSNNNFSRIMNREMGAQLLADLAVLDNQYASSWLRFIEKILIK